MLYPTPLLYGTFIKRYKRFFVDVALDEAHGDIPAGAVVVAHCPNTGSMKGVSEAGMGCWVSPCANPNRKLKYTLELVDAGGTLVGVHTHLANTLVAEAVENGGISELSGYETIRQEVKYGAGSRIDLLLESAGRPPCYVEVKNTTLLEDGVAKFPDAVTTRGAKHLDELMNMVSSGARAVMCYLVPRSDARAFAPADAIDPVYGQKLRAAVNNGVEIVAVSCQVSPQGIEVEQSLAIEL